MAERQSILFYCSRYVVFHSLEMLTENCTLCLYIPNEVFLRERAAVSQLQNKHGNPIWSSVTLAGFVASRAAERNQRSLITREKHSENPLLSLCPQVVWLKLYCTKAHSILVSGNNSHIYAVLYNHECCFLLQHSPLGK